MKKYLYIFLLFLSLQAQYCIAQAPADSLILSPENRELKIQRATQLRAEGAMKQAIEQLDSILMYNFEDAQILLFKGDLQLESAQPGQAVQTYKRLLDLNYEPIATRINLSYALFQSHKPEKALKRARSAWELDKSNRAAIVNYFNAMLWNLNTKDAAAYLKEQQSLLSAQQILVLKARLKTSSGAYLKGLSYYDQLVSSFPDRNYINEFTDVLLAKKEIKKASEVIDKNKSLFSEQELADFAVKVKAVKRQQLGTEFIFFKDLSGNTQLDNVFFWQQGLGRKYRLGIQGGISKLISNQEDAATVRFMQTTLNQRWSAAWKGLTELKIQRIQSRDSENFTSVTGRQLLQYQPNDRRMFGVFYNADILYFTASLLQKNVRSNKFGYVTHIMPNGKMGFYSEGSWSKMNDQNTRLEFFGSFYRLLRTEPTIKTGINFSALHFRDNDVTTYFAPNRYLSTEVFADYTTALPDRSKFYLHIQGAAGYSKSNAKTGTLHSVLSQNWDTVSRIFKLLSGTKQAMLLPIQEPDTNTTGFPCD